MAERIIQFGTSRFLQAHADLFIHEAREAGQHVGPITVVKATRGGERANRVSAFSAEAGFPVIIRGLFGTNVGESGYAAFPDVKIELPSGNEVPLGFPAKRLSLLVARFRSGGQPMLILPCELVPENGKVLRQILVDLAQKWKLDKGFNTWLASEITICDTLVDRIVSEAIEPVGAIAEPYALWAIRREATYDIPFSHPAVVVTDGLEPFVRLKLHIINLGHSFLAEIWQSEKRPATETVREILGDAAIKLRLTDLYAEEATPGFAGHGMKEAAVTYVETTIDRFDNPFINHKLSDIFQNRSHKIERRVVDFIAWIKTRSSTANVTKLLALSKAWACCSSILFERAIRGKHLWICGD